VAFYLAFRMCPATNPRSSSSRKTLEQTLIKHGQDKDIDAEELGGEIQALERRLPQST